MNLDILLLMAAAIGLPAVLALALRRMSKLWSWLRAFDRWALCVPVGYLIAIALALADAKFGVTGGGEANLSAWVSYLLVTTPVELLSSVTVLDPHVGARVGQVRFWLLALTGLLVLTTIGLSIDGLRAVTARRNRPESSRRPAGAQR